MQLLEEKQRRGHWGKITEEERAEILVLYESGETKRHLAKLMGRSRRAVREVLINEGIE